MGFLIVNSIYNLNNYKSKTISTRAFDVLSTLRAGRWSVDVKCDVLSVVITFSGTIAFSTGTF